MLDVKELRTNLDEVSKKLQKRNKNIDMTPFVDLDKSHRKLIGEVEEIKNKRNVLNKEIPKLKKEGQDTTKIMEELKEMSDSIKEFDQKISEIEKEISTFMMVIPNIPQDDVPDGEDETSNLEMRKFSEPTKFTFEPKPHWEIGENLKILDPEAAAKITGARFTVYKGFGARLERAIINFMLDTHVDKNGYTEVMPPFMVNRKSMTGTGQLPKFEEDAFKVADTDYFLVPTAEVPVTNLYSDTMIEGKNLPICHCAYTACFRAEAGSAGRDTRGLIRQHQFNKVELVKFTRPEDSNEELEKLTNNAEEILKALNLPYRVVLLCGGDLGFSSAKTYDIEVWMPSYNRYVEISSCSNFGDFQARRANIKFKDNIKDKASLVHTLNGSGLAAGRTTAAILENFQQEDGSVIIPDVLVPYMGGIKEIPAN